MLVIPAFKKQRQEDSGGQSGLYRKFKTSQATQKTLSKTNKQANKLKQINKKHIQEVILLFR